MQRPPAESHVNVPSSYDVQVMICAWQCEHIMLTGLSLKTMVTNIGGC